MANRSFVPAGGTLEVNAVQLYLTASIGASGATSALKGNGIKALTRVSAGLYKLQLQDAYNRFLAGSVMFEAPQTGSAATAAGSFVTGTAYQIVTLGTTTQAQWVTAGVDAGVTAVVGTTFIAAAAGAGNGTAKALLNSGISQVEWLPGASITSSAGNPIGTLNKNTSDANGGYLYFQCLASVVTMASYTPAGTNNGASPPIFTGTPAILTGTMSLTPTDPVSGSLMKIRLDLRNSSVKATGE